MLQRFKCRLGLWAKLLAGIFVALQFARPRLENPRVEADFSAPPAIQAILQRACYDCHSYETKVPWFDQIVPAYWLVVRDVREGRRHLNFSELGADSAARKRHALRVLDHVLLGAMPPPPYLMLHRDARVSGAAVAALKTYLQTLIPASAASAASSLGRLPAPGGRSNPRRTASRFPTITRAGRPSAVRSGSTTAVSAWSSATHARCAQSPRRTSSFGPTARRSRKLPGAGEGARAA